MVNESQQKVFRIAGVLIVGFVCLFVHLPDVEAEEGRSKSPVRFLNVTDKAGVNTVATWKYGGPAVADLDFDGFYDLMLGNHADEPAPLFFANGDGTFRKHEKPIARWDVHGIAAGDYDLDGDADVLVSMGGGNGKNPQPPRLMRNDGGEFLDVTDKSGIAELGARGRTVRWIDVDGDADLDMLQINAAQVEGEVGPRNILFRNDGDGTFTFQRSPAFEHAEAERVLLSDFDGDNILDLIAFSPLSVWRGTGDFKFEEVTKEVLPKSLQDLHRVNAVAECDIDNDGDMDLYLARGQTYYRTANNAISFNEATRRLDLRDEGNQSHDGITFFGGQEIALSDFFHWPRGKDVVLPVHLGAGKKRLDAPKQPLKVASEDASEFPDDTSEDGWFLGYLGDGEWRLEWNLSDDLAWDIRASISGVDRVKPDWKPQALDVPDVLLLNEGGTFEDISDKLPAEAGCNNWGVTCGDFDNDSRVDFFVYRFGELRERIPDVLIMNRGAQQFDSTTEHGANVLSLDSHGDMGSAFDFDRDGAIDLLSGDDNPGRWYLYRNQLRPDEDFNYMLVHVGYSDSGVDPLAAKVVITTDQGQQTKRVGSAGAVHSQSVLNLVHFGIGSAEKVSSISVRWRDGSEKELGSTKANQIIELGSWAAQDRSEKPDSTNK